MAIELRAPGARAVIEPAHGGRMHQLFVEAGGREEPLLASPRDPADYAREPLAGGCYPMAPWPNRIRDAAFAWRGRRFEVHNGRTDALHGLVLDQPWDVVARAGRVIELSCEFGDRWPWPGKAWQRIELGDGFLAMKLEVRSAREEFPAGCGWHPWFRRNVAGSQSVRLTAKAHTRYILHGHLPTGERVPVSGPVLLDGSPVGDRRLDDCYTGFEGAAAATIEWERLQLMIAFECPAPHLQVYTPEDAICIEPQTSAPDAFNLAASGSRAAGAFVVAPGRALSLTTRWTWQAGPP